VIDKDHSAALLARELGAGALLLLTDVAALWTEWRTPRARAVAEATPDRLAAHEFAPGSMAPKVAAACAFVEATGGVAGIGELGDAARVLEGTAGTRVRPGSGVMNWYQGSAAQD
jgi:carbamate kinase